MHSGRYVFSQVMDYLPREAFDRCVQKYSGNNKVKSFTCRSQFLCMSFGQLTYRNGLRNIVSCLRANQNKLIIWAVFRRTKGGIKLHTILELPSSIPTFIDITEAKPHDVSFLDRLILEPGAYYIMDRGYMDFVRLYRITKSGAFFVVKAKDNIKLKRRYSHAKDTSLGILSDQTVIPKEKNSFKKYPAPLRRVRFQDPESGEVFIFLTNNFEISAITVANLYKARWKIELFFKWIKQHLQIKRLFGHTLNAVKTQIWIAVAVYVLVAIIRKRLDLMGYSLYNILQVLSVTTFCYDELSQLFEDSELQLEGNKISNQLSLFDL